MNIKIAFVVQRYGIDVNGGAEVLCRHFAEKLSKKYNVEVLTSKSKGMIPWDNAYANDVEKLNGVKIRRFNVEDSSSFSPGTIEFAGPYCPTLIDFLKGNYHQYKVVIFITYGYYTTNAGLNLNLPNGILMPTAHDIPSTRTALYGDVFIKAKGIMYQTPEEKEFVETYYDVSRTPSCITCFGLEVEKYDKIAKSKVDEETYILYMGRVSNSKNFRQLNDYFLQYKKRNPSPLKMVVLGKVDNGMTIVKHDDIIFKGFVTEEEKINYIKNALITVLPSKNESLSIVVLESLICRVPVLVNGLCAVLKGQCIRSNAGLYYTNYCEFEKEMSLLLTNKELREKMGESGREFVIEGYTWCKVINNFVQLLKDCT